MNVIKTRRVIFAFHVVSDNPSVFVWMLLAFLMKSKILKEVKCSNIKV